MNVRQSYLLISAARERGPREFAKVPGPSVTWQFLQGWHKVRG